jgi:hypothetical protein
MIAFEKYLIDNGYIRLVYDYRKMKFRHANDNDYLSTLGTLAFHYIQNPNNEPLDKIITDGIFTSGLVSVGLNEVGMPPTLISPRPVIIQNRNKRVELMLQEDHIINRMLASIPFDEILNAMFDRSIRFEYNPDSNPMFSHLFMNEIYITA